MRQRSATPQFRQPDAFTLAAGTWLASGLVLLGLTPLPLRDPVWGWSPVFWLLAAPCVLLLTRSMCACRVARRFSSYEETPRHRRTHGVPSMAKRSVIAAPTNPPGLFAERRVRTALRVEGLGQRARQAR